MWWVAKLIQPTSDHVALWQCVFLTVPENCIYLSTPIIVEEGSVIHGFSSIKYTQRYPIPPPIKYDFGTAFLTIRYSVILSQYYRDSYETIAVVLLLWYYRNRKTLPNSQPYWFNCVLWFSRRATDNGSWRRGGDAQNAGLARRGSP